MNLTPGMVLLTVDNYSMISAQVVDNWLAHRSKQGPISFTVAIDNNGQAQVKSGSVQPDPSTAATAATTSANASAAHTRGSRADSIPAMTRANVAAFILQAVNKSRAEGGLAPLQSDPTLGQFAQSYADYLATNASKYDVRDPNNNPHQDLNGRNQVERAQQAGITNWQNENIGRNVGGFGMVGVSIMHNQMMESASHRPAIMDPEAHFLGVGATRVGDRLFLVEEFGR